MTVSRQVITHEGQGGSFESMWVGDAQGGAKPGILLFPNILGTKDTLAPLEFTYDFMTRTGRMDDQRLRNEHPNFMARYERRHAEARTT